MVSKRIFVGAALVAALAFAGCGRSGGEEDKYEEGDGSEWNTNPQLPGGDGDKPLTKSIKGNFGITTPRTQGVTDTFKAVAAYIAEGGMDDDPDICKIKLGYYIDLEDGLTVAASNGNGGVNITWSDDGKKGDRSRLRLIVVGINSFHSGRGVKDDAVDGKPGTPTFNGEEEPEGQYTVTDNNDTPHVVFQFQNLPASYPIRRVGADSPTSPFNYLDVDMWAYLNSNFLTGLKNAGVPEGVLWAPKRYVAVQANQSSDDNSTTDVEELLWLPTRREMFGKVVSFPDYPQNQETPENQARLEYYYDETASDEYGGYGNALRTKYSDTDAPAIYWLSSPVQGASGDAVSWYTVRGGNAANNPGDISYNSINSNVFHIAPAFCVKGVAKP